MVPRKWGSKTRKRKGQCLDIQLATFPGEGGKGGDYSYGGPPMHPLSCKVHNTYVSQVGCCVVEMSAVSWFVSGLAQLSCC